MVRSGIERKASLESIRMRYVYSCEILSMERMRTLKDDIP